MSVDSKYRIGAMEECDTLNEKGTWHKVSIEAHGMHVCTVHGETHDEAYTKAEKLVRQFEKRKC